MNLINFRYKRNKKKNISHFAVGLIVLFFIILVIIIVLLGIFL